MTIDGRACVVTALTDITDRTRAEDALRESERRFARLFHANPLPMSIVGLRDGRHLDVNNAAVRHSGYSREEMLGRTKAELGFWVAPERREEMHACSSATGACATSRSSSARGRARSASSSSTRRSSATRASRPRSACRSTSPSAS